MKISNSRIFFDKISIEQIQNSDKKKLFFLLK